MTQRSIAALLCLAVLALLASLLYLPFLSNGWVFDDANLFANLSVYDYATKPVSLTPRALPYFSLGLVQVIFGSIEAQRTVSLILHIACSGLLFALLKSLLSPGEDAPARYLPPLAGALWFALNPVAVYGAAYLAERTIVFATLFSLACLLFFVRGFRQRSTTDLIVAAVLYSAAVFSKEHAVMLPLAALPLLALAPGQERQWVVGRAALFLLLCLPAAALAVFSAKAVIGSSYEPDVGPMLAALQGIDWLHGPRAVWLASAAMQARAFFLYFYYWLVPDVRFLSVDMRVDFLSVLHSPTLALGIAAFLAAPLFGLYCLSRGRSWALFGCGLLFSWLLFITELSSVRLQEPFVLYRSYLWAPGFAMMLAAVLGRLRWQWLAAMVVAAAPLAFMLAQDRLQSFASERSVWQDAADKLASPDLPGADRIYYNLGGERFKRGELDAAMADLDRVVSLNPKAFHGYLGRGMIYLAEKKYAQALAELDHALSINPAFGFALYRRGVALENLGRGPEALSAYRAAAKAGFALAKFRADYLESADRPGVP